MPRPRVLSAAADFTSDCALSAIISSTPCMRAARSATPAAAPRPLASRSRRNSCRSRFAAAASSSTNGTAREEREPAAAAPARRWFLSVSPVLGDRGYVERRSSTNGAGNSVPRMSALVVNLLARGRTTRTGGGHADELVFRASTPPLRWVESLRAMKAASYVVLARPEQLHRHAGLLRDRRGFDHVVVVETTTEPCRPRASWGLGDAGLVECLELPFGARGARPARDPRCTPHLHLLLALNEAAVRRSAARGARRRGTDRVLGFSTVLGAYRGEHVHVAVLAGRPRRRRPSRALLPSGEAGAALRRRCAFVPRDLELAARLFVEATSCRR